MIAIETKDYLCKTKREMTKLAVFDLDFTVWPMNADQNVYPNLRRNFENITDACQLMIIRQVPDERDIDLTFYPFGQLTLESEEELEKMLSTNDTNIMLGALYEK